MMIHIKGLMNWRSLLVSNTPSPLLQDPLPCVHLLCMDGHVPCQRNLAINQDEPPILAAQWHGHGKK